jgi:hypothetical protein
MADDVILNKAASIERCLHRIVEEYGGDRQNFFTNQPSKMRSFSTCNEPVRHP